jgi:hypothetical protein
MISAPQIDAGVFFSSVHTLNTPSSPIVTPFKATRTAMAWSGTLITIDPRLHDVAHGSKDVVVWAKGTLGYDYTLAASPGRRWYSQPDAASARVAVMARLIRYDRQTGKLVAAAEEVPGYFATQTRLDATLVPNGTTTVPPSCPKPLVGGPYAAWSTGQDPFYLDLPDGQPRWLRTDSFYYVAVLCAASLEAKGAGPAPEDAASASVSATMHLQLVTLGIRPHDPSTL